MGVTHLQSYLHDNKNKSKFCRDVHLKDLVRNFRDETKTEDVTIVIDGICFLFEQYDLKNYDCFMGGELLAWKVHVEKFLKKFKDIGVKLVFFFDGTIVESKTKLWLERQKRHVLRNKNIFDKLKSNGCLPKHLPPPSMVKTFARFILKHIFNCEVHISVGDCDREMARFARDNNCLAIMGQDTDFIIFEGARYYLRMSRFIQHSMKTICYDQREFALSLSLSINQLPLLATLLGNDYVSLGSLLPFQRRICGYEVKSKGRPSDIHVKLPKVADFVRSQPTGSALFESLPRISKDVFGKDMTHNLLTSLNSYNILANANDLHQTPTTAFMKSAYEKHINCDIPKNIYPLLIGEPYELKTCYEDFSADLPSIADIFLPLRQKLYGVLLHDDDRRNNVEEWCVHNPDMSGIPQNVPIIRICKDIHPGLEKMWSDAPGMKTIRWKIFASVISPDLAYEDLQTLPMKYVAPAALLHYLLHGSRGTSILKKHEVDAFISETVLANYYTVHQLKSIVAPRYLSSRMVHIASIITKGMTTVQMLMAVCGFSMKNITSWLCYDGKLFHSQYICAEQGQSEVQLLQNQTTLLEDFKSIEKIAYSGVCVGTTAAAGSVNQLTKELERL